MKFFLLFSTACCVGAAVYPSTYPFENESLVPVDIRPSTPSYTFDGADPGGYIYTYNYAKDLTDDDLPWCPGSSGSEMHNYKKLGWSPVIAVAMFNCSTQGRVIPELFTGVLAGETICKASECCKEYIGLPAGKVHTGVNSERYTKYDDTFISAGCTENYIEAVYCHIFAEGVARMCTDQYISATERLVVSACYDALYRFYINCALFKVGGKIMERRESDLYIAENTMDENTAWSSVWRFSDRVCRPYSYFFPETSKDAVKASESEDSLMTDSPGSVLSYFLIGMFAPVLLL